MSAVPANVPKARGSRSYPYVVLVVVLVAVPLTLLRLYVRPFRLPTRSMEPTILQGDCILANHAAYALTAPWADSPLVRIRTPKRGDVVTYRYPMERSRFFTHRVIGLPGETVRIEGRKVEVDGVPLEETYAQFLRDADDEVSGPSHNWGPEVVPTGHVFTLGDNRDNSRDGRYWGFVPVDDVLGRVYLIYWSVEPSRDEPPGPERIRWDRIGRSIR